VEGGLGGIEGDLGSIVNDVRVGVFTNVTTPNPTLDSLELSILELMFDVAAFAILLSSIITIFVSMSTTLPLDNNRL
jgi:hypothetical protein